MSKCFISMVFILFYLSSNVVWALDKAGPISLNTVATGKLAEDVVFNEDTVFAMPAEIILDSDNECHIFGFIVLGEINDETRLATGIVKRLVCKNTENDKGFSIWNVGGDFVSTAAQPTNTQETPTTDEISSPNANTIMIPVESSVKDEKTIYTVKAGISLTVNPTKIGIERAGKHIYLFANDLTPKPFKIHLGQLPSFGGEKLEAMPALDN